MVNEQKTEGWISDLVGALTDPVICHPQWMEKPPEKIQNAITLQRLIENMAAVNEGRTPLGTDAECSWYLSSTSLVQPLSSEWVRIYMYCFSRLCSFMRTEVPEGIKQEELSEYEKGLLLDLKQWIYKKRAENRKQHERSVRQELKARSRKDVELLQPAMFEF